MRVVDDALRQTGLADAGLSLDQQDRGPAGAEPVKFVHGKGELGVPPQQPVRRRPRHEASLLLAAREIQSRAAASPAGTGRHRTIK
jgi:hypothetical protein